LAQARTNYWRWYREKGKGVLEGRKEPGGEDTMWINLRELLALEEEEEWKEIEIEKIEVLDNNDRKGREDDNRETISEEEKWKEKVREVQESGSGGSIKMIREIMAGSIPGVMSGRSPEAVSGSIPKEDKIRKRGMESVLQKKPLKTNLI
jgi:hypothetical protein